jgi:hypothetical protein
VRTTLVAAGLLGAAITIGFLFMPGMRQHDHPPAPAVSVDSTVAAVSG